MTSQVTGCGAPDQAADVLTGVDLTKETVIAGTVVAERQPVGGAYVRLLDGQGEFTAEVVTSPEGRFRFFAAPGNWALRVLSRNGNGDLAVTAERGLTDVTVPVTD